MTHHTSPAEAAILTAATAWRRSLDVDVSALNGPARLLAQAVDAGASPGERSAYEPSTDRCLRFDCSQYCKPVNCGECRPLRARPRGLTADGIASSGSYALDERTPAAVTDYGFAAERDRQLVASRAEAKREVERLRGELTRERAKVASMEMVATVQRGFESSWDALRAKVAVAHADLCRQEQRTLDVTAERDALLVTVRMMARATWRCRSARRVVAACR